ncbi:hypothetical protein C8R43DRAFT_965930 [Mycena crocata]|nr:hypothetical protein C8R43DRAFT_965930 [Mycena crocata]
MFRTLSVAKSLVENTKFHLFTYHIAEISCHRNLAATNPRIIVMISKFTIFLSLSFKFCIFAVHPSIYRGNHELRCALPVAIRQYASDPHVHRNGFSAAGLVPGTNLSSVPPPSHPFPPAKCANTTNHILPNHLKSDYTIYHIPATGVKKTAFFHEKKAAGRHVPLASTIPRCCCQLSTLGFILTPWRCRAAAPTSITAYIAFPPAGQNVRHVPPPRAKSRRHRRPSNLSSLLTPTSMTLYIMFPPPPQNLCAASRHPHLQYNHPLPQNFENSARGALSKAPAQNSISGFPASGTHSRDPLSIFFSAAGALTMLRIWRAPTYSVLTFKYQFSNSDLPPPYFRVATRVATSSSTTDL